MTASEFNEKLVDILGGDNFFLTDRIDQEDLFRMQDDLANLIAEAYNTSRTRIPLVLTFARKCPRSFSREEVK